MPKGPTMLAEPATIDSSFKKIPENLDEAKSQVMWAVENEAALKRYSVMTTKCMKNLGKRSPSRGIKTSEESSDEKVFENQGVVPKSPGP